MINIQSAVRGMSKYWKLYILGLYRVDQTILPQLIQGNINATGYITGLKTGIFAYLSLPAITKICSAGLFTYVEGTFTNDPRLQFTAQIDKKTGWPEIMYEGKKQQYFLIDWHATFYTSKPNSTVRFGIYLDDYIVSASCMCSFAKNNGLFYNASGTVVILLAPGQRVSLVVTSDILQDITIQNFTTTITEFFD